MKGTLHVAAPLLLMLHAATAHQTALCVSTTPNRCEEAIMWFVTWHQGSDRAQQGTVTIENAGNGATTTVSLANAPYCEPDDNGNACFGCDIISEIKSDCTVDKSGNAIVGMDSDAVVACYGIADVVSSVTSIGGTTTGLITKRIDLSMGTALTRKEQIWNSPKYEGYNTFIATLTGVTSDYYIVTSANTDVVMDPQGAVGHPAMMQSNNIAVLIEAAACGTTGISCGENGLPNGSPEFTYNNPALCDDAFVGQICPVTCTDTNLIPNGMVICGSDGNWINTVVCDDEYVQVSQPPSPPPGGATGDPHLTLAYGGKADFRGMEGNGLFNLLSAAGLSLNALFSGAMFKLREVTVDGSFMTEAHLVARTASGKDFKLSYDGAALTDHESWRGAAMVTATCGDDRLAAVAKGSIRCDNLEAIVDANKLEFKNKQWFVKITGVPVYNRLSGPHHRVDIALQPVADTAGGKTHGLVGQSFDGSEVPRYGRLDQYPPLDKPAEFKTSAMAEGAIEGVAADYQVADKFATAFKFSRFEA